MLNMFTIIGFLQEIYVYESCIVNCKVVYKYVLSVLLTNFGALCEREEKRPYLCQSHL